MKYHYSIIHVPGKQLETADALSRATSSFPQEPDQTLQEESNIYLDHVVSQMPASPDKLEQIRVHQQEDEVCQSVIRYCQTQWPAKHELPGPLKHYWQYQGSLTVGSGLLLFDSRIFIPSSLRLEMLTRLHDGHQGVTRTKARARQAIWWPGIGRQIEETMTSCTTCTREQIARVEPLKPTLLPDLPWQRVGTDFSLSSQDSMWLLLTTIPDTQRLHISRTQTLPQWSTNWFQIMARSTAPQSLLNSPEVMGSPMWLAAPSTLEPMALLNALYRHSKGYYGKPRTLTRLCWHTAPHPSRMGTAQPSFYLVGASAIPSRRFLILYCPNCLIWVACERRRPPTVTAPKQTVTAATVPSPSRHCTLELPSGYTTWSGLA